ncbi:hypothetical protein ABIA69_001690 [Lysinibacillus parviboronicapiens]|uniref:Uncharacterized protein n=2 Tax=Lysinibacillus TaxID=400634 RepID=R7Z8K1_LYSSH|nr:hypothetical protein [Lysinibacillus sphaericus]EON70271.1 hypothetical protein H131_22284 [Lysinibacillus sphaericus OT4b.31]
MININYFWQISKYKDDEYPLNQQGGSPTWTSVSDIGTRYNGRIFTVNEYLTMEETFIKAIQVFMTSSTSTKLMVKQLEKPLSLEVIEDDIVKKGFSLEESKEMLNYFQIVEQGMSISFAEVEFIIRLALREYIWVELESETMFVRFDYDYYVDIGSTERCDEAVKQVCKMNLSVNLWDKPYPFSSST